MANPQANLVDHVAHSKREWLRICVVDEFYICWRRFLSKYLVARYIEYALKDVRDPEDGSLGRGGAFVGVMHDPGNISMPTSTLQR